MKGFGELLDELPALYAGRTADRPSADESV